MGGIGTAARGIQDESVLIFWWLYPAVCNSAFFLMSLLRYFRRRLWEVQAFGGLPPIVYVSKQTEGEDQAGISRDCIAIYDLKRLNECQGARGKKQGTACIQGFSEVAGGIGNILRAAAVRLWANRTETFKILYVSQEMPYPSAISFRIAIGVRKKPRRRY